MDLTVSGRRAVGGLAIAALLVGLAIALDGPMSKAVNGVGGLAWLLSTVFLIRFLRTVRHRLVPAASVAVVVLVLATVIRPSDVWAASVGFFLGGAVVSVLAAEKRLAWSAMVPAMWLPVHLSLAIARGIAGVAPRIRTDPPPTAALVPLAMVIGALAGGAAVRAFSRRRQTPAGMSRQPTTG